MLTGVTVEPWDTMFYMKDCKSPQEYDQAKFRIMSPYVKEVETIELDDEGNIKLGTPTKIEQIDAGGDGDFTHHLVSVTIVK